MENLEFMHSTWSDEILCVKDLAKTLQYTDSDTNSY